MSGDTDRYPIGSGFDLFQPQVILPSQHFKLPGKCAPEHRLMMAVVEDAIHCLGRYRMATDTRSRRLFREARQWLLAKESHWPYSFEAICTVLDLDASAVRRRLHLTPQRRVSHPLPIGGEHPCYPMQPPCSS
jgi:hypothetical protein